MSNSVNRDKFPADELVKVPAPNRPVVLKSGGPVMDLETIDGDNGLCSWFDDEGKISRAVFPLVCLYACIPVNNNPLGALGVLCSVCKCRYSLLPICPICRGREQCRSDRRTALWVLVFCASAVIYCITTTFLVARLFKE